MWLTYLLSHGLTGLSTSVIKRHVSLVSSDSKSTSLFIRSVTHCVIGETLRYFTTLVAVPAIKISFCLRISCLFSSLSIVKTIEPNLVYGLYLFTLDKIHLGSSCILIGLKVSISSFRSLEPPSSKKGRVGTPWAIIWTQGSSFCSL